MVGVLRFFERNKWVGSKDLLFYLPSRRPGLPHPVSCLLRAGLALRAQFLHVPEADLLPFLPAARQLVRVDALEHERLHRLPHEKRTVPERVEVDEEGGGDLRPRRAAELVVEGGEADVPAKEEKMFRLEIPPSFIIPITILFESLVPSESSTKKVVTRIRVSRID